MPSPQGPAPSYASAVSERILQRAVFYEEMCFTIGNVAHDAGQTFAEGIVAEGFTHRSNVQAARWGTVQDEPRALHPERCPPPATA